MWLTLLSMMNKAKNATSNKKTGTCKSEGDRLNITACLGVAAMYRRNLMIHSHLDSVPFHS